MSSSDPNQTNQSQATQQTPNNTRNEENTYQNQLLNQIKNYNPRQHYTKGSYVDALDSYSTWRFGKIMEIKGEYAQINFDGWASKWNENIKLTGQKIAPFRKNTIPYTGGTKGAVREFDFEESKKTIQATIEELNAFGQKNFQTGDAYYTTQFLRGNLYVLLDSVLQMNVSLRTQADLKLVQDLMECFVNNMIRYLDILPAMLKQYIEAKSIAASQPVAHMVDEKVALVAAIPEMFDTLQKIFGGNARIKLFSNNDFPLKNYTQPFTIKQKEKYSGSTNNQIINNSNLFGSLGGFDKVVQLIQWESKFEQNNKTKIYKLPLGYLKNILAALNSIIPLFTSSFKEKFSYEFKKVLLDRLNSLTHRDIKENEISNIFSLIRDSQFVLEHFFGKESYIYCEQTEVEAALTILKGPYFDRKIKALNEFKDFFDRANPHFDSRQLGEKSRFRYWNNEKLKTWITEKRVLEYVLDEAFHPELVKRLIFVLKFLANQGGLTNNHLDLLWKCGVDAHEENVRAVYETITDLSTEVSVEINDYIFSKIITIPISAYDQQTVKLIKEFSLNAMSTLVSSQPTSYFSKATKKITKYDYYGLKLLWDAIQDQSELKDGLIQPTFSSVVKLIKNEHFKNEREKYLTACFENVKAGASIPQSLMLSLHILSSFTGSTMLGFGSAMDDIVNKFQKEYGLIDLVVADFQRYMIQVEEKLKKLQPENTSSFCFVGRYSHLQNIENRLLFIENIGIQLKKGDFGLGHMKKLWTVLVKKSVTEVEKNAFLNWLTKQKDSNYQRTKEYVIPESLRKHFFNNVLCDSDCMDGFKDLTPETFKSFEKYFEIINEKEKNIEVGRNFNKTLSFENVLGIDALWSIYLGATHEKVLNPAKVLLVNTYLKLQSSKVEYRLQIWQNFINKVVKNLQEAQQNGSGDEQLIQNLISLLNTFVVSFDGKLYYQKDGPNGDKIQFICVDKKNDSIKRTIDVPSNGTLFLLRKKMAEAFTLPLHDFDMYLNPNFKIPQDIEEDYAVTSIEKNRDKDREKDISFNIKTSQSNTAVLKEKFKTLLINNQHTMDLFFDLLGSHNKKIVDDIWELVSFLPVNRSIKQIFEKLNFNTDEAWAKSLDTECPPKLLYCLNILNDISQNNSENKNWNIDFIKKKGFHYLLRVFYNIQTSELTNAYVTQNSSILMAILGYFMQKYPKELGFTVDVYNKTIGKVLDQLRIICHKDFQLTLSDQDQQLQLLISFLNNAFSIMKSCVSNDTSCIKTLFNYEKLQEFLDNGLIENSNPSFRQTFATNLLNIADLTQSESSYSFFFSFLLKNILQSAFSHRSNCKEFFELIQNIYLNAENAHISQLGTDLESLAEQLADNILNLEPYEKTAADSDNLLQGLLSFLEMVLSKNHVLKQKLITEKKPQLIQEILQTCLFEIPTSVDHATRADVPKCKSPASRKAAFNLLQVITSDINELTSQVLEKLKAPLLKNFWRTPSTSDWNIVPLTSERSRTGFVGLQNLGCTCYMNSLMQQFFMIPDFRNTIISVDNPEMDKNPPHENLLHQVGLIFCALKLSQRQYYDPRLFCHAFKDYDGNPINVLEQMDVDEFFNNILDKLENQLKKSKADGIIQRIFGGVFSNELICKGCPHYSETEEPYLAVSLQVKNKKSITESLQSFIQGDMLEGDNAYYCDKCEKKVSTLKRTCIKKLPNILILVLKRFEFNFDTMQKVKVNEYCEFPQNINMQQYTQAYLKKQESQNKEDGAGSSQQNNGPDLDEFPPEYYEYQLRGVVIHLGTAESGHYYSFIKDNSSPEWFEFNDNIVRPFDPKDLSSEAFGGEEKLNIGNIGNAKDIREKSRNAYLLFYERKQYFDKKLQRINSLQVYDTGSSNSGDGLAVNQINPKLTEEIKEDNFRFQMTKFTFDKDYGDFIYNLLRLCEKQNFELNESKDALNTAKFCTTFFLSVILRAQDRMRLPPFLKLLKSIFRKSDKLCKWFLKCFCDNKIIKEFLITCTIQDMKYFVVGLIKIALKQHYAAIPNNYQGFKNSIFPSLIDAIAFTLFDERENIKILDKVFEVFSLISDLGTFPKIYMINKKMIGRLSYFMSNDKIPLEKYSPHTKEFVASIDEVNELGEPTQIKGTKPSDLVKSVSEMIDKKKEKIRMDQKDANFSYLIEALANLVILVAQYKEISGDKLQGAPNIELEEDEKVMLFQKLNFVRMATFSSKSKRSRKIVATMVAALAQGREEYSKDLLALLEKELNDKDEVQLKVYLQALEAVMLVHDDFQKMRVEKGFKVLVNVMKENAAYYRATEICIDYLFKICARNSLVLRLCSENKAFLKFVETWLREYSNPYTGFASNNLKLFKKRNYQILGQAIQQNHSKFISKCQERLAKLKRILKNESEELAPEYDSDVDFSDHQYQVGEKIDYLIDPPNGWGSAIVIDNLEEMINIRLYNDSTTWIYFDEDRIGPHLKVQTATKNNIDFYKA